MNWRKAKKLWKRERGLHVPGKNGLFRKYNGSDKAMVTAGRLCGWATRRPRA